jgi:hypothetical protein
MKPNWPIDCLEGPNGDLGLQLLELEIEDRLVERFGSIQILHIDLDPGEGVGGHGGSWRAMVIRLRVSSVASSISMG